MDADGDVDVAAAPTMPPGVSGEDEVIADGYHLLRWSLSSLNRAARRGGAEVAAAATALLHVVAGRDGRADEKDALGYKLREEEVNATLAGMGDAGGPSAVAAGGGDAVDAEEEKERAERKLRKAQRAREKAEKEERRATKRKAKEARHAARAAEEAAERAAQGLPPRGQGAAEDSEALDDSQMPEPSGVSKGVSDGGTVITGATGLTGTGTGAATGTGTGTGAATGTTSAMTGGASEDAAAVTKPEPGVEASALSTEAPPVSEAAVAGAGGGAGRRAGRPRRPRRSF